MKRKISLAVLAIIMICLLVFVPVISASVYFTHTVSIQLERNASETVSVYLEHLSSEMDSVLRTLGNCIYYLTTEDSIQALMQCDTPATQIEIGAAEQQFSRAFTLSTSLDTESVSAIYLIKNRNDYFSVYGGSYDPRVSRRILNMYRSSSDLNSARDLYTDEAAPGYAYMIANFTDLDTFQPLGKIIIELDMRELLESASLTTLYPSAAVLCRATDGDLIGFFGSESFSALPDISAKSEVEINGSAWYHDGHRLSAHRVRIDVYIPHSEILHSIQQSTQIYVMVTAVILLLTLLIAATLLLLLVRPLRQMLQSIGRLASGDLSVRMQETPYRETETFVHAFNDMADQLDTLFYEVYEKGLLLRDAEIGQLEAQIHPHFIFNVLELINMRCMAAGQPAICTTVQNLAQLMRANVVHTGEQTITFREELEYVKYYLALQKDRFEEKLQYAIDIEDDSILDYSLPKLTIQPLIENSIVHGLEPKRRGGSVRISVWEEEDAVCVRVSDNGVGFDPAILDQPRKEPGNRRHAHVALRNIERRIKLLYGKNYGMTIHSAPNDGTSIVLTLPIIPSNDSAKGDPTC